MSESPLFLELKHGKNTWYVPAFDFEGMKMALLDKPTIDMIHADPYLLEEMLDQSDAVLSEENPLDVLGSCKDGKWIAEQEGKKYALILDEEANEYWKMIETIRRNK